MQTATATRNATIDHGNDTLETSVCESLSAFIDETDTAVMEEYHRDNYPVRWVGRDMESDTRRKATVCHDKTMRAIDNARDAMRDVSLPKPVTRSRRVRFDEFDGDDICLDRLRDGAAFWRTSTRQQSAGPQTVTIGIDVCAAAAVSADAIAWRGVAGIILAELLESAGIRVELWAMAKSCRTYENGNGRLVAVKIKSADSPLDQITLANALSGWFFRSFILQAFRTSPFGSETTGGLGYADDVSADLAGEAVGVAFDAIVADCFDQSACVETVQALLTRFGGVAQ